MSDQRRHEAPDVGDAIVRMLRGLVVRAEEGDAEAIEQLHRIEHLAPVATALGAQRAQATGRFSFTWIGAQLGVTRQAARQRATGAWLAAALSTRDGHQLLPGHSKRGCERCR